MMARRFVNDGLRKMRKEAIVARLRDLYFLKDTRNC
jgi:hypothetical protein